MKVSATLHAERFNLVVEVNVAPCIDCGCTREARRAAPYLERDGEHRDHHHDDARDRKREPSAMRGSFAPEGHWGHYSTRS